MLEEKKDKATDHLWWEISFRIRKSKKDRQYNDQQKKDKQ